MAHAYSRAKVLVRTELLILRKEFPEVELGVCDCWSFNKENRLPAVEDVKSRYPGINFDDARPQAASFMSKSKEMFDTFDQYKG